MHLRHLNSFSPPPQSLQTLNITNEPRDTHASSSLSPSFLIVAIILTLVFIISAALHFLLSYLNHHHHQEQQENDNDVAQTNQEPVTHLPRISTRRVAPENNHQTLIDSLPIFSYTSISNGLRSSTTRSADCAVCLSKFEPDDQLRLLPLCCHAFHLSCIDTWLETNHTCPLCRSTIHVQESDQYKKLFQQESDNSFRIEMGNVSSRRINGSESDRRRSYSIGGSFEYLVDDETSEVVLENHRKKEEEHVSIPVGPGDNVATEVGGGGRGWLKDYVDRLASSVSSNNSSSFSNSFRFSGRFFTGSSRRSDGFTGSSRRRSDVSVVGNINNNSGGSWDLEGNTHGEEIGNFLRWLSGV